MRYINSHFTLTLTFDVELMWRGNDHLLRVYAAVERPSCLEVLLHALLQRARNVVSAEEVFEVPGLGLVDGSPSVHALYDCCHVTEYQSVH